MFEALYDILLQRQLKRCVNCSLFVTKLISVPGVLYQNRVLQLWYHSLPSFIFIFLYETNINVCTQNFMAFGTCESFVPHHQQQYCEILHKTEKTIYYNVKWIFKIVYKWHWIIQQLISIVHKLISNAVQVLCKSILKQCIPIFKSSKIG